MPHPAIYLLALLLTGLGYLAILPAFEGFDENAHYSLLRQIADTGKIPLYGKSTLDRAVEDYKGPVPYGSLTPPFDKGLVYSKFFAAQDRAESYDKTCRAPQKPAAYKPGRMSNWQAQHPPLYYVLLAPLEKITRGFSLVAQIFTLRFASYLLALAGVFLGFLAAKKDSSLQSGAAAGFMLYPIILPMFFPEFTRIGNDSLCLFLAGLTAFLLSAWLQKPRSELLPTAIGLTLGLGLLTKAFFIPIAAAIALFLLIRSWKSGKPVNSPPKIPVQNLLLVFIPALFAGAGWYIYKFAVFGDFIGGNDAIRLIEQGGLLANLEKNFSFSDFARAIAATFASWSWAGTWSLARLPPLFHLPLLLLALWVMGAYFAQLKRISPTHLAWLPVWLLVTFACGLLYHMLISIAINGNGNTPGWYLHILMPWLASAIGIGILATEKHNTSNWAARWLLRGLLLYAVCYQLLAIWSQFALFTGCATKGDDKYYAFSGEVFCLDQFPLLAARLAILGWPYLAAIGFTGGALCFLWLFLSRRTRTSA